MKILGIETSCDETAAAVVENGTVVHSNVISSQIELHKAHGGVVPELAARGQITAIIPVIEAALAEANCTLDGIHAIAFTNTPGLAGSLLVGVNAAKAWAWSTGKPMIAVNHLEGHVHANWLQMPGDESPAPQFPAVCLLVSGGHTELILMRSHNEYELLGETIDDAAGEAFDKGARLLGLSYPGGPAIQRASEGGNPAAFAFPRSQLGDSLNFSFSGLKTSLLRQVDPYRLPDDRPKPAGALFPMHRPPMYRDDLPLADLAASYQEAIVDILASKLVRATEQVGAATMLIAGGVAANRGLRERVEQLAPSGIDVRWPAMAFCTDNAAMIAGRAWHLAERDMWADLATDAQPKGAIPHARG